MQAREVDVDQPRVLGDDAADDRLLEFAALEGDGEEVSASVCNGVDAPILLELDAATGMGSQFSGLE